jgi:hypothetical protein
LAEQRAMGGGDINKDVRVHSNIPAQKLIINCHVFFSGGTPVKGGVFRRNLRSTPVAGSGHTRIER